MESQLRELINDEAGDDDIDDRIFDFGRFSKEKCNLLGILLVKNNLMFKLKSLFLFFF